MGPVADSVGVLIDAWKVMVGRLPGGEIEHADGMASCFGHVPLPFFNLSFQDGPLRDYDAVRRLLALGRQRAARCAQPTMLTVCQEWAPPEWEAIVAESGWTHAMNLTGMEAAQLQPPRRPPPAMELRLVAGEATARDLATINAHAYGMPVEMFECICNLHLWHADSFGYVGYVDGRAVTSAAAFPAGGTVYVALVATMPDAHGKGYAEAVMRRAVAAGQQEMGISRATLHASDAGRPLYQSMGYQDCARLSILSPAGTHE